MLHRELGNISDHLNLSRTELAIFTQLFAKKNQLVARADLMSVLRGQSHHIRLKLTSWRYAAS